MQKKMVLHVTGNLDSYNGAGMQAITLAKNIDYCHNVIAYFTDSKRILKTKIGNLTVYRIPNYRLFQYFYSAILLISLRPDIIHIHGYWVGYQFIPISWLLKKRIIVKSTLMGVDDLRTLYNAAYINRLYMKMISVNNALSNPIKEINERYIDPTKIVTIPNAFEFNDYDFSEKKEDKILIVGAVSPRKRVHLAIKFFLKNFNQNEVLYVIGPLRDKVYYSKCKSVIPIEKSGQIIFTGELDQKSVFRHYHTSKVLLNFSETEGMPNSVIEAMAYNCVPIISWMNGISVDLITKPSEGVIIHSYDEEINWDQINMISAGKGCYYRALAIFDAIKIAALYRKVYNTV